MKWEGDYDRSYSTEFKKRFDSFYRKAWWRYMPGKTIEVAWPESSYVDGVLTNDPNDHYRPWLEHNVGKQHWDWNVSIAKNKIIIKFRMGKKSQMMQAAMQWS